MAALTPALPLPCLTGFCSMAQPLHCAGGAGRGCAGARRGRVSRWLPRFAVAIGLPWPASCLVHWPATGPAQDTPSPCPGLARPSQLMPYCAALPLRPSRLSYPLVLLTAPCRQTDMVEYSGPTQAEAKSHCHTHLQAHRYGRVLWPEAGWLLLHRWVPLAVLLHARFGLRANTVVTLPAGPVERWGRAKQPPNALSHHTLTAPRIHVLLHSLPLQSTAGCRATAAATPARPSLWATSPAPR